MISESLRVTEELNNRRLIPPIGVTLKDYYEGRQFTVLSPGDDFVEPIFSDLDFDNNKMLRLLATGSKGKMPNLMVSRVCRVSSRRQ